MNPYDTLTYKRLKKVTDDRRRDRARKIAIHRRIEQKIYNSNIFNELLRLIDIL